MAELSNSIPIPGDLAPLEIHTINVSQGDSILIIHRDLVKLRKAIKQKGLSVPDNSIDWMPFAIKNGVNLQGTVKNAVLIDAGDREFGKKVIAYMAKYGVAEQGYTLVVTHYHNDHYGGMIYSETDKKNKTKKDEYSLLFRNYRPSVIYDCGTDAKLDPLTTNSTYKNYVSNLNYLSTINPPVRRETAIPNKTRISLEWDQERIEMNLRCVASNGVIATNDSSNGNRDKKPEVLNKLDQNSRSVSFILEYGAFRYYLAGDLGGNGQEKIGLNFGTKKASKARAYWNIETALAQDGLTKIYPKNSSNLNAVPGYICCWKCSHHGSDVHSDVATFKITQPAIAVISSGLRKKFHKHPDQATINRLDATQMSSSPQRYSPKWPDTASGYQGEYIDNSLTTGGSKAKAPNYYITEMANSKLMAREFPKGKIIGTTIIRPYAKDIQNISKDPNKNSIRIQVYGLGDLSNPDYSEKLRAITNHDSLDKYPVGPWVHTSNKH